MTDQTPRPQAPDLDVERLARAIRAVTVARHLDIIENDEQGDMAAVVYPGELTMLIVDAYWRDAPRYGIQSIRVSEWSEGELREAFGK